MSFAAVLRSAGAAAMQGARRSRTGPTDLIDYSLLAPQRASEASAVDPRIGWPWYDLVTPWPGVNVPRIYSDGAILVEGASENKITQSENAILWVPSGTVVTTPGQAAPDGAADAYRIADAGVIDLWAAYYIQVVSGSLAVATHTYSVYVLKDADTSRFPELGIIQGTAVITGGNIGVHLNTQTGATATRAGTPTSVSVSDAGAWWRVVIVFAVTTGGTAETRLYPAFSATLGGAEDPALTGAITAWGVQVEAAARPSSPVRTAGAAATRASDNHSVVLGAGVDPDFFNVGFEVDIWPTWAPGEHPQSAASILGSETGPNKLSMYTPPGRIDINVAGVQVSITPVPIFGRYDKVTVRVPFGGTATVQVNDVAAGSVALPVGTWAAIAGSTWGVGHRYGAADRHANAVISRPRAL